MEEITLSEALNQCHRILGEKGRLSTAMDGFVHRKEQFQMSSAIVETILEHSTLVVEAGTGTGKTFAYLVPCLLSGKKILISTATKTLQDQLFHKDVPKLLQALGLPRRIQNLKGRNNYLCRYRIALYSEVSEKEPPHVISEILYVREKLPQLTEGTRSELPEISEDSHVWSYVTSTADNCLGSECKEHNTCFLVKARKRAMEADLVIINHHLFFADVRLKEEGFGELLPGVDVVVFDEAHQLAAIAAQFHGKRIGTRQIERALDDTLKEWPVLDLANQPLKKLNIQLHAIMDKLLLSLPMTQDKFSAEEVAPIRAFIEALDACRQFLLDIQNCFTEANLEENKGLSRCKARFEEIFSELALWTEKKSEQICWVERFKQHLVFHATPVNVAPFFKVLFSKPSCAFILTSATLTLANSFDCFIKTLGLLEAKTLLLQSPFDFNQQAMLYLPRKMPDPHHPDYHEALLARALPLINACKGRCFFLFTSHRALKQVALLLTNQLDYPLLIQGEEAKPILLERFRQLGDAVLLGTATFWEGVDVKGDALSCVIIDKLPFASPLDPVVRGKLRHLKQQGLSGFDELSLPEAVLALKQGVGRLIRDVGDKGVLMIADPRLTSRDYGQRIFLSLPQMKKTRDEQKVLTFIEQLA